MEHKFDLHVQHSCGELLGVEKVPTEQLGAKAKTLQ